MKSKVVVLMCVLMASLSFGSILVANFEDDGLDYGWGDGGATLSTGPTGATLDDNALGMERYDGGWGGTMEIYLMNTAVDTPAKVALASTGTVTVDVTAFGGTEVPAWWGSIGLLINSDITWNSFDWQGLDLSGTPTSMTFQLDAAAMADVAASIDYCNIGFIVQTGEPTYDDITGDRIEGSMFTAYIDNVQVVPEPATLSLLGLGALAMLKRRKA